MALIKVRSLLPGRLQGPPGRDGKDGVTKVITEVVERRADLVPIQDEIKALKEGLIKLTQRRPETIYPGGGATTKYIFTEQQVTHYRKPSFVDGVTVIGVRYNGPATVYLPHDLDPTMLVSVKDEVGSGNITIFVE